jgi:hypothetical protein
MYVGLKLTSNIDTYVRYVTHGLISQKNPGFKPQIKCKNKDKEKFHILWTVHRDIFA